MFKKTVSISFSPNFERDDVVLASKLVFDNDANHLKATEELKKWFKDYTGHKYAFLFSSGRAALYYILKSMSFPTKTNIATQTFTCVAVPNSIIWAGFSPLYVDIDPKTYNINPNDFEKKISEKTRAIIIQHTFGIPADVGKILAIARKHNIIVIEDCAHSIGTKYENRPVGSFGNASFFSFGRDKVVSSIFGGVATTSNDKVAKKLGLFEKNLTPPPNRFVQKQFFYPLLYAISNQFYSFGIGKGLLFLARQIKLLTPAVSEREKEGRMPEFINYSFSPRLAQLAVNQIGKIDKFNRHRKELSLIYAQSLGKKIDKGAIYLRYPVEVVDKEKLLNLAKKQNVHLGDWYREVIYPANNQEVRLKYSSGSNKESEEAAKRVVNLPTHIKIGHVDALRVIAIIKPEYDNH